MEHRNNAGEEKELIEVVIDGVQISCKEVEAAKTRVMNMDMQCGKKNPSV